MLLVPTTKITPVPGQVVVHQGIEYAATECSPRWIIALGNGGKTVVPLPRDCTVVMVPTKFKVGDKVVLADEGHGLLTYANAYVENVHYDNGSVRVLVSNDLKHPTLAKEVTEDEVVAGHFDFDVGDKVDVVKGRLASLGITRRTITKRQVSRFGEHLYTLDGYINVVRQDDLARHVPAPRFKVGQAVLLGSNIATVTGVSSGDYHYTLSIKGKEREFTISHAVPESELSECR